MPEFLKDEQCERCGGPLLNEPYQKTTFIEATLDYLRVTVWICYACGKETCLQSSQYYCI